MYRLFILLGGVLSVTTSATTYSITSYYGNAANKKAPYFVRVQEKPDCVHKMDVVGDGEDTAQVECVADYLNPVRGLFGVLPYILQLQFDSAECTRFVSGFGVPLSNTCVGSLHTNASIASLNKNGSASILWFSHSSCLNASWVSTDTVEASVLENHSCDKNWRKWYNSKVTRRLQVSSDGSTFGSLNSPSGDNPSSGVSGTSSGSQNGNNGGTSGDNSVGNESNSSGEGSNTSGNVSGGSSSSGTSTTTTKIPATNNSPTSSSPSSTTHSSSGNTASTASPPTSTTNASGTLDSGSNALTASGSSGGANNVVIDSNSSSGGISIGGIVGIAFGCIVTVLVVCALLFVVFRRRDKGKPSDDSYMRPTTTATSGGITLTQDMIRGQTGLWNDDIITAKRISRNKVQVRNLISRGGYGEVYAGVFHGRSVAIKMLLAATHTDIKHVNNFLAEAKMAATMDHPRIVSLVGIAWDSLSDLCVVLEYMEGGDLRTLLDKYQRTGHPTGLDHQKANIAIHVCHALTYLHSLLPAIIHRDLKSRNVLLNRELEAKLTDFGVSRERLDGTMTAGVGTSLWMAPEVMMGERYDDKADIFSLGVLLSELDVHTLPYAREKRTMSDAVLLHRVAMGSVRVSFSPYSPRDFQELGYACVSVNPGDRPSAAEVLYKLQIILSRNLGTIGGSHVESSGSSDSSSYTI
ncbi:unnamed protein product [Phytophthora fragariaefolia]|uniref:Unnamed protein product n=1 Tax=Phytophthora fragariaefolia TaxID=1490495 RepID=A0A9W7CNA9_9STRA|nr:unnamed protein product [Phytophthora fragariaefolia]